MYTTLKNTLRGEVQSLTYFAASIFYFFVVAASVDYTLASNRIAAITVSVINVVSLQVDATPVVVTSGCNVSMNSTSNHSCSVFVASNNASSHGCKGVFAVSISSSGQAHARDFNVRAATCGASG